MLYIHRGPEMAESCSPNLGATRSWLCSLPFKSQNLPSLQPAWHQGSFFLLVPRSSQDSNQGRHIYIGLPIRRSILSPPCWFCKTSRQGVSSKWHGATSLHHQRCRHFLVQSFTEETWVIMFIEMLLDVWQAWIYFMDISRGGIFLVSFMSWWDLETWEPQSTGHGPGSMRGRMDAEVDM